MLDTIPTELRSRHQWVCWRREQRKDKWTKIPVQVDGANARANDSQTWTTFEEAAGAAERFDGIGFVFSPDDPFCGIDLDAVVQLDTGELHQAAMAIVEQLDSYTEVSPSGTGLHIVVRAQLNGGPNRTSKTPWGAEFENYDRERYFCMTGNRLRGATAEPRQAQLDAVRADLFPTRNGTATPLARRAAPAPNPAVLERWAGNTDFERLLRPDADDESGRDYALACFAVEHGTRDIDELVQLVGAARVARCPGDTKAVRGDYLLRTAHAALAAARHPDAAHRLTELLGQEQVGLHVTGTATFGRGGGAKAHVQLSDGQTIVFEPMRNIGNSSRLAVEIACSTGAKIAPTKGDAIEALSLIHDLADAIAGSTDDDIARDDYGHVFLADARERHVEMADQTDRWRAFNELKASDPVQEARDAGVEISAKAIVLVDDIGTRYVPVDVFCQYVRRSGWQISPGELKTRMLSVGWKRRNERGTICARQPGGKGQIVRAFYLVAAGWEHHE